MSTLGQDWTQNAYSRSVAWWVERVRRGALAVVLAAFAVAVLSTWYAAGHLNINTDTSALLSNELPVRKRYAEFRAAFPQFADSIAIVIDADSADRADEALAKLSSALLARSDMFLTIFAPERDPYFRTNGFLFLKLDELRDLSDRMAGAQGLLTKLASDMTLAGLFDALGLAAQHFGGDGRAASDLSDTFDRIARIAASVADGKPRPLSWSDLLRGRDSGDDDRRRFIVVQPKLDYGTLAPAGHAIDLIRTIANDLGITPDKGATVRLTGSAALETEEMESVSVGASLSSVISFLAVAGLLVFGFKSLRLIVAALVALVIGLLWTAAFTAFAIGHLNLISIAFAVLFIGIAVDFSIQFGLRYQEEIDGGRDHADALDVSTRAIAGAIGLCALAAAIGFYSFVPTDYVGLSELGVIAGTSMIIGFVSTFTVMPAVLTLAPVRPSKRTRLSAGPERFIRRHAKRISLSAIVLGFAGLALLPQARFDSNPIALKDPSAESVRTFLDLAAQSRSSPFTIQVLAANIDEARSLAAKLEQLKTVDSIVTAESYIPSDQDAKLQILDNLNIFLAPLLMPATEPRAKDDGERLEAVRSLRLALDASAGNKAAQAIQPAVQRLAGAIDALKAQPAKLAQLEDALLRYLPARIAELREALGAQRLTLASLPKIIRERYVAPDGRVRLEVFPAENLSDMVAMRRFVSEVQTVAPQATDSPVEIIESGDAVVDSVRQATSTAAIVITLALLALFRSLRDTFFVLLPLVLAGIYTLVISIFLDIPFNYANVIVLPLLAGLGVASGINLVIRARIEPPGATLAQTSTPRAVVFSALTTIVSFGSLAVSGHRGTQSMGLLLVIALTVSLLCALFVLPALMAWLQKPAPDPVGTGGDAGAERGG